jgi:multicomponent Na+:H+ antiporter subunit E
MTPSLPPSVALRRMLRGTISGSSGVTSGSSVARAKAEGGYLIASLALRFGMFLLVWLALTGGRDIWIGLIVTGLATWASLWLQPPAATRISYIAFARLGARFLLASLLAGVDVARRALSPSLPVRPGLLFYPVRLPRGPARDAFRALMCLQPGSLPTEAEDRNGFIIHCLDLDQPVLATFAAEEEAFARAAGISLRGPAHG